MESSSRCSGYSLVPIAVQLRAPRVAYAERLGVNIV